MTNAWQKAERLERESLATVEPMIQRFKKKGRYWDYVESRGWHHSHEWSLHFSTFQKKLYKFLGKPFSLFHKHITASEDYKYNGMARYYYSKFLLELGRYNSDLSANWFHNYYTDSEGLIVAKIYEKRKPFSRPSYPDIDCEFDRYGYPILYKNGIHYIKSFTYRKRVNHSKLEGYDSETGVPIWKCWTTLEPVWQQMAKRDLRALNLINK